MKISEILGRFSEVTPETDGGYLALCPAHADGRPSLRIWLGDNGTVRLTCRAGCATQEVISAVHLGWRDMFSVDDDAGHSVPAEAPALISGDEVSWLDNFLSSAVSAGVPSGASSYLTRRFGLSTELSAVAGIGFDDGSAESPYRSSAWRRYPRIVVPLRGFDGVARGAQGRDISGGCPVRWVSLSNPPGARWGAYGVLRGTRGPNAPVVVTEGPSDGLTAYAQGYDVVFIRGAAIASNADLLKELADGLQGRTIIAAGDADTAGQGFNRSLVNGLGAHALSIPAGLGPKADLAKWRESDAEGFAETFSEAIAQAASPNADAERCAGESPERISSAVAVNPAERSDAYWAAQAELLDVTHDIRHVNFARFVADHCGESIRYVRHVGWFRWTGRVWEETGDSGAAMQAVTDAAQVLLRRASESARDMTWASKAASKLLVHLIRVHVVAEMETLPEFHTDVDTMDAARHLLTFTNGTVDLRTSELREHRASDMLTQCTNVDFAPDAPAPRWLQFIDEVFPGDRELQSYMQTFLGMCISGETRDHALGVWYGEQGRNGKGTIIRTMSKVFGKAIIQEVPFALWENARGQSPHTELIAGLRGARMVVAQEGSPGTPMNTSLLKNYSGGDRISTRHLHGKQFTYDPKFTIVLTTNFLPEFSSGGAALWARTKAVLFGQSFADRVDVDLEPTIQGPEAEGVAAWIVAGARRYYEQGRLRDPLSVLEATEHHKDEVDPLKPLVGELFEYDADSEVKRSAFNAELREWRSDNGEANAKFSPSAVKRQLLANGVREERKAGVGWIYRGIYLMSDPPQRTPAGPGIFDTTKEN